MCSSKVGGIPSGRSSAGSGGAVAFLRLRFLNAALDFAYGVEIIAHFAAVGRAERSGDAVSVSKHKVEDASVFTGLDGAGGGVGGFAVAKEPLEDIARIGFVGKRSGG